MTTEGTASVDVSKDRPGVHAKVEVRQPGEGEPEPTTVLVVPDVSGMDVLAAALAYAKAGWYVGPCKGKHPGSVLGKGWQTKTSRDPRTIIGWYAGAPEGLGVFLHVGRSGAVAFDRDEMTEAAGEVIAACILADAPRYTSRRDDLAHTTCVVLSPHGAIPSNRSPWKGLDVRGANGVIVAPPSPHPEPDGLYRWRTTGPVPPCPPMLAAKLTPAAEAEATATDAEVRAFLVSLPEVAPHPDGRTEAMLERYQREARAGSRHQALVAVAPWFVRAGLAGVASRGDLDRLAYHHQAALRNHLHPHGAREPGDEVAGVLAWALAQAQAEPEMPMSDDAYVAALQAANPPAAASAALGEALGPTGAPDGANGAAGGATEAPAGSSWGEMDPADWSTVVAEVAAGAYVAPEPSIGRVPGGAGLLYPGKVHDVHGVGGGGKSFVAALVAAEVLADGENVVWIDLEDSPATLVDRLVHAAGLEAEALSGLRYVRPVEPSQWGLGVLCDLVQRVGPALVVLDSTGEGLAIDGVKPNDDDEVARWMRRVARTVADVAPGDGEPGPAVLLLDHVPKADEAALLPIGSQRKQAALTGVTYSLQVGAPFSRHEAGWAVLIAGKDRQGFYKRGQVVARLDVAPGRADGPVARLSPPPAFTARAVAFKRTKAKAVVEFLATSPGTNGNGIGSHVGGNAQALGNLLTELTAALVLRREDGPNRSYFHYLTDDWGERLEAWDESLEVDR